MTQTADASTGASGTTPDRNNRWRVRKLVLAAALTLTGVAPLVAVAAPSSTSMPDHVQVRSGDTLASLALRLRVEGSWQALYQANRNVIGADPTRLKPGTVLLIPTKPVQPAPTGHYTVQPGDTLSTIAARVHCPGGVTALYATNRSTIGASADRLTVGQELTLPSSPPTPSSPAHPTAFHATPTLAVSRAVAVSPARPLADSAVLAHKSHDRRRQSEAAGAAGLVGFLALLGLRVSRRRRRPFPADELGPIGVVTPKGRIAPRSTPKLAQPEPVLPEPRASIEAADTSVLNEGPTIRLSRGAIRVTDKFN